MDQARATLETDLGTVAPPGSQPPLAPLSLGPTRLQTPGYETNRAHPAEKVNLKTCPRLQHCRSLPQAPNHTKRVRECQAYNTWVVHLGLIKLSCVKSPKLCLLTVDGSWRHEPLRTLCDWRAPWLRPPAPAAAPDRPQTCATNARQRRRACAEAMAAKGRTRKASFASTSSSTSSSFE